MKSDSQIDIKMLTLQALVSDDELMDTLVLKGGNAIDLIYGLGDRTSLDLDFSLKSDFDSASLPILRDKLTHLLVGRFGAEGLRVYDVQFGPRPQRRTEPPIPFWGGYQLEFKIIPAEKYESLKGEMQTVRRQSLRVAGPSSTQTMKVEMSKYEVCEPAEDSDIGGYTIRVYTPTLIVIEKLRAICQQTEEYKEVVPTMKPSPRAKDFFDIHRLVTRFKMDIHTDTNVLLVHAVFDAKKVPLALLGRLEAYRDFHAQGYASLKDTIRPNVPLRDFDFYFDFVARLCEGL